MTRNYHVCRLELIAPDDPEAIRTWLLAKQAMGWELVTSYPASGQVFFVFCETLAAEPEPSVLTEDRIVQVVRPEDRPGMPFLLDPMRDRFAATALEQYAESCENTYPGI